MALGNYTRANLQDIVLDSIADPSLGSEVSFQDAVNRAARFVYLDVDIKSSIRKAVITPSVFDEIWQYTSPTDLKDEAIIDIRPQAFSTRRSSSKIRLVGQEEFDRKKGSTDRMIAVQNDDMVRTLLIDLETDDEKIQIATMDSLTGDGSNWAQFNDATNVTVDGDNKISGSASLKFDLTGAATTAGLVNSGLTTISVGTDVFNSGVAFAWAYINDTTNLTNWVIRLGNDASNYHQSITTVQNDGAALVNGWNLIRWNWSGKSTTGTVDPSAIDYAAVYMTKTSGKADDGYRIDDIQCHQGTYHELLYYSKFPWQSSAEAYLENSTAGTDRINADTTEIDGIAARTRMEIARRRRDREEFNSAKQEYDEWKKEYKRKVPSQRLKRESFY